MKELFEGDEPPPVNEGEKDLHESVEHQLMTEHFLNLKKELRVRKVDHFNISTVIEKKDPLMQRLFGGHNRSEISIDIPLQQLVMDSSLIVPTTPTSLLNPSALLPLDFTTPILLHTFRGEVPVEEDGEGDDDDDDHLFGLEFVSEDIIEESVNSCQDKQANS